MIKARNKKLSLILVLAMLVTMFAGLGTASATSDLVGISGSYNYVDADDNQPSGAITLTEGDDYDFAPTTIYAEVTLPDGVTFTTSGNDSATFQTVEESATLGALTSIIKNTMENIDIDSDFTGSVTPSVRVWGVDEAGAIVFDVTDNVTIAKVAAGNVTVTAKSAKTVSVGSAKQAAKITLKEGNPGALTADGVGDTDNNIILTINASGVKWDTKTMEAAAGTLNPAPDPVSVTGVTVGGIKDANFSGSDKTLRLDVTKASVGVNGSINITPYLLVQPGATGDVVIKISGDDVDTTSLTVATIGEGSVAVTVTKADKDTIYQGQTATSDTFSDVEVKLDPSNSFDTDDYITVTLPKGVKFLNDDDWTDAVITSGDDIIDSDTPTVISVNSLYNDDQSAWLDINKASTSDVVLSQFRIAADSDAAVGDLNITFGGAVTGTYKIGTIAAPITVTAAPVQVPLTGSDIAGGKITITEADAGALIETDEDTDNNKEDGTPSYLDITLPMGVTFSEVPTVKVTDGDLNLGDATLSDNDDVLQIPIDGTSNLASTIEITGVKYDVDNRASAGDITAKVGKAYNLVSSNPLTTVKIGTIGTVAGASFVIGASTYTTADGTVVNCVANSYIANSRSYLAIRDIAHVLGITDSNILWDGTNNTVTLMKGDKVVQLKVGSNVMYVNGAAVTMDTTVQNVNSRTFLPAAFVAQAFGATATWDGATSTVTIK